MAVAERHVRDEDFPSGGRLQMQVFGAWLGRAGGLNGRSACGLLRRFLFRSCRSS